MNQRFSIARISGRLCAAIAIVIFSSQVSFAENALPSGKKVITLVTHDGKRTDIGHVMFVAKDSAATFRVELNPSVMFDNFLSMRNFQCLQGATRQWCHLPYLYGTHATITAADLIDLEYALMFLWRPMNKVSADPWNGLYFKLALAPDGTISGALNEADMNVLASPPDEEFARPIAHGDLTPANPATQEWARIELR